MRGYRSGRSWHDMKAVMDEHKVLLTAGEWQNRMALVSKNERQSNEWFDEQEKMITWLEESSVNAGLYQGILSRIHAVEFAKEWAAMERKRKISYRMAKFNAAYPNAAVLSKREADKLRKKMTSRHEKVVSNRNQLLDLFNKYHVAILLDPFWTLPPSENNTSSRSKSFSQTLPSFLTNHTTSEVQKNRNINFFKHLIRCFNNQQEIPQPILAFLDANPM
ncbi:hypothetical protein BJ165DRAFT_1507631 [Panaeolus papilionaceus]|nr:hypothetical protein BJ165DRAFT_1507631 [Panaeolus papilionaceus]